jgi:hypothetical protein
MDKYDLIRILNYASKNFDPDNGEGYWVDFEDPQGTFTSEEVVEKYFEDNPSEKECECDNDSSCIREENGYGDMIDYCLKCKARRK